MRKVSEILRAALIGLIKLYQMALSPYLVGHCRFEPSCSEYAITAIRRHGVVRGLWLATRRLLSCHPFSSRGGFDPVPLSESPEETGEGVRSH